MFISVELQMNSRHCFLIALTVMLLVLISCSFSSDIDLSLNKTKTALVIQQTSVSLEQTQISLNAGPLFTATLAAIDQPIDTLYPTLTSPAVIDIQPTYTLYPTYTIPPNATSQPPTIHPTIFYTDTPEAYFQSITVDRKEFYCVSSNGPTTLTITVELSNVDRGADLYWRLSEKKTGNVTNWESVNMNRIGGNARSFTFNANSWEGTNNFFYPPLMGESWFEFQIISNDGKDRTRVFSEVTFFPCAQ